MTDFQRNCRIGQSTILPLAGVPVYYYRCPDCGFLFTHYFDGFSHADFARLVYNEEYIRIDPDYKEQRPAGNAQLVGSIFTRSKQIRVLDYGGGNGRTAQLLRDQQFAHVDVYDPFVPQYSQRPEGTYDLIISFEVVEHSPTPLETFREMVSFMGPESLLIFSTLLQPADILQQQMNWWYLAPRNGHVSFYTAACLRNIAESHGLIQGSFNDGMHALVRGRPPWAQHLLGGAPTPAPV